MSTTSDFYLEQAEKSSIEAADATLSQVRDRHLRSAAAWRAMAAQIERAEAMRLTSTQR